MNDPLVEEIHAIRKEIAEQCDHDIEKIGRYFMQWQKEHPELLVRKTPKAKTNEIATE
jgi:hypothetical protein